MIKKKTERGIDLYGRGKEREKDWGVIERKKERSDEVDEQGQEEEEKGDEGGEDTGKRSGEERERERRWEWRRNGGRVGRKKDEEGSKGVILLTVASAC